MRQQCIILRWATTECSIPRRTTATGENGWRGILSSS